MDLLPTPVTERNKQRTGAHFTIRAANSPSYSLKRRPGVRGAKSFCVEEGEDTEEVGKREKSGTNTNGTNEEEKDRAAGYQARNGCRSSVIGQCEEKLTPGHDKSLKPNQNGIADKMTTGTGRSENPAFGSWGSAESRRSNWQSRSKSLDWRTANTKAEKGGEDFKKQIGGLEERQSASEGVRGRLMFSRPAQNSAGMRDVIRETSPGRYMSQPLDRTTRGCSLPSRFRPRSSSDEPTGGQSILERIEKLYGSAGLGKDESPSKMKDPITSTDSLRSYERAAGATLPKERSKKSITWASQAVSETFSPGRSRRLSGDECQGKIQGSHPEDSGANWRKGFTEVGTKSLDRARSRNTKAAHIREMRSKAETNGMNWAKETDEIKGGGGTDDVFESNPKNSTLKTTERKKLPEMPTAASVRNKISQFEALSQRAQGLAAGPALMPRRAMSVPTQLNKGHDGVKKSGSAKAIGGLKDRWDGRKEAGDMDEEKATAAGKKAVSERSQSLDEVGLRLRKKDEEWKDSNDTGGKSNEYAEDLGKYSRLKGTLEIRLNEGAERKPRNFYIDETDFSKLSSPEESRERNSPFNSTPSTLPSNPNHTSTSVQKITPTMSPVSNEDKTPTNTPDHSPFHSPSTQQEYTSVTAQGHNRPSVITQEAKICDPDSSPPPRPLASSSHSNLPDLISPDIRTTNQKGNKQLLDMDAWVAGLKSDVKVWYNNEDDDDDDDNSTQKDEDSNYDSDSGESSVTITSNMSQSDRRSFSVSLSDLCNFAGVDYESENDSDEWQLVTGRTASLSSDVSVLSYVSVMPTEELDRLLEDVKSLGDNTLQDYDDVQVVVLHKEVGVGLGFSVAGGVDQSKPVTVHKVFHSGVAAQEGSIREGDQVLSINGTAFQNYAHWEALRVLRRAKTREMAVVVLRRGGLDDISMTGVQRSNQRPTESEITETGQQMCVHLEKNNRDLGFSLEGGVGSSLGNRPLTVQKIFQGGPVDKVCPGDELMEIEGVSVLSMRRLEAWTLIRKLPPGPVNVVLRRPLKHLET